ncbi:hypothetical protein Tco_1342107, partial [Tanacetum coccineum]
AAGVVHDEMLFMNENSQSYLMLHMLEILEAPFSYKMTVVQVKVVHLKGRGSATTVRVGTHRNPSDLPNHHTPAVTTSGTPSDTSGGRLDSTSAFSYQPRKRTRGSIFIQKDSGTSGISSSKRPRVCNDGRSRKPSGLPNYPTPAATTSGTPSDTATSHV